MRIEVIEPSRGVAFPDLRELAEARELIRVLIRRDIQVRYRQTVIGALWAVLQPLGLAAVFSVFLGRLAKVPSQGDIPYPLLAFSGMVMWIYFQTATTRAAESTISAASLISKVYFPRAVIPIVAVAGPLVDLGCAFAVLLVAMTLYGYAPGIEILAAPAVAGLAFACALGIGLWFSSLAVRYRDIQHIVPFLVLVGMFVTPVVYPFELVPHNLQPLYALNPTVGVLELWRWALFGEMTASAWIIAVPIVAAVVALVSGALVFSSAERTFADDL